MESILIVEDDADVRITLEEIVKDEGYRPVAVEAGDQAMAYLSAANDLPCLVLLDLKLPRVDGKTLLQWMRAQHTLRGVRVAVMSASAPDENDLRAFREHVVKLLRKPFDLDAILATVKETCHC